MTTTITAYRLSDLFRKVDPHIGRDMGYGPIQGVRLDNDGRHLHAVATDRYTLAAARIKSDDRQPWAATIKASSHDNQLAAVTAWLATHDGEDRITLNPDLDATGNTLTLTSRRSTLTVPVYAGHFPDWRGLIRTAKENQSTESPWTGYTSSLLARWEAAGRHICAWQSAFDKPLVITGTDFVGIQMPRPIGDDESPAGRYEEWADSLGDGAPVQMDDTLTAYEPQELEERDNAIGKHREDLLKQVLRSTTGLFNTQTGDPAAIAAYALAGGRAWLAYRLTQALAKADSDLLRTILDATNEELESGEIGEWAWDEAERAGHNPQQWHDDYEAHLKKLADAKKPEGGTAA